MVTALSKDAIAQKLKEKAQMRSLLAGKIAARKQMIDENERSRKVEIVQKDERKLEYVFQFYYYYLFIFKI